MGGVAVSRSIALSVQDNPDTVGGNECCNSDAVTLVLTIVYVSMRVLNACDIRPAVSLSPGLQACVLSSVSCLVYRVTCLSVKVPLIIIMLRLVSPV